MRKILALLMLLCLTVTLFSGCTGSNTQNSQVSSTASTTEEKKLLRVAVQSYYCSSLMGLVEAEGWADDYNLDLEYSVFSSGATINEAMGEWDVAVTGGAFIYAMANYDCKLVAHQIDGTGCNDIFAREGSDIAEASLAGDTEKVAELVKGKTILTNVGITGHYGLTLWLKQLGLNDEDVNFISQDMSTIYSSWVAGEGDLAVLTFPYGNMVQNSVVVGSLESAGGHMFESVVCTADAYENNYDAIVDFVKLIYRACDMMSADSDLAFETVKAWYTDNGKDLADEDIADELSIKPFFTSDYAKTIDLTDFASSYGEYLIGQGLIEQDRLEVIIGNCRNDILQDALSDEIFN